MTPEDVSFLERAKAVCTTKAAFFSRSEAVTFARRRGYLGSPYACPWCDQWHLTTHDKRQAKEFRRKLSRLLRETA